MVALATTLATLATAPSALAVTSFTWSGGGSGSGASTYEWSNASNWSGSSPTAPVGAIDFPELGGSCDAGTSADACYGSVDDLGPLTVSDLDIDTNWPYALIPEDPSDTITLDDGIEATPSPASGGEGPPDINIPIILGQSQTWSISGGTDGDQGLEVDDVSGNYPLTFTGSGTLYATTLDTGALTVGGSGSLVAEQFQNSDGSLVDASLPTAGTALNGTSIYVNSPGTTSGSLTASGNQADQPGVYVGGGTAPDATVAVAGAVSFDEWTNLYFDIETTARLRVPISRS